MPRQISFLALCCFLLVACAGGQSPADGGPPADGGGTFDEPVSNEVQRHEEGHDHDHAHEHIEESEATAPLEVALVTSELVLGPNRFAVGLFDEARQVVQDADVHFHYYDLTDPAAPALEMEADATAVHTPDGRTTIYTHERAFERAGEWGVEVQARFPDGSAALKRIGFEVLAESPTLKPGQTAPALETPTLETVDGDLALLTSAFEPDADLYRMSLAQALSSGKPTALLFATPAFCQTRFCGPAYEEISALQERYGDQVNFIHVEVYTGLPDPAANDWEIAPAMRGFGLTTEPWLYLIDGQGQVAGRLEGIFSAQEVERRLAAWVEAGG